MESPAKSARTEAAVETSRIRERIVALDEAFAVAVAPPSPQLHTLKLHLPAHEEVAAEVEADTTLGIPEFDEELPNNMLANLVTNGMTLVDLAG
jgi:hypothetical protein